MTDTLETQALRLLTLAPKGTSLEQASTYCQKYGYDFCWELLAAGADWDELPMLYKHPILRSPTTRAFLGVALTNDSTVEQFVDRMGQWQAHTIKRKRAKGFGQ